MKNRRIEWRWIFVTLVLLVAFVAMFVSTGAQETPTPSEQDGDNNYEIMFTKWVDCYSEAKDCETSDGTMVVATMPGIITGGDAGTGSFSGEVLELIQSTSDIWEAVTVYRIHGTTHDFSAHMLVMENPETGEATLVGIIADGWLKGQIVQGSYNVLSSCPENPNQPPDPLSFCVPVTLHIHEGD